MWMWLYSKPCSKVCFFLFCFYKSLCTSLDWLHAYNTAVSTQTRRLGAKAAIRKYNVASQPTNRMECDSKCVEIKTEKSDILLSAKALAFLNNKALTATRNLFIHNMKGFILILILRNILSALNVYLKRKLYWLMQWLYNSTFIPTAELLCL